MTSYLIIKYLLKVTKLFLHLEFSTGLLYNLFLRPSAYLHFCTGIVYSINSTLFIVLTPLASFMADVIFGRFKHYSYSLSSCWLLSAWWYFVDLYSK